MNSHSILQDAGLKPTAGRIAVLESLGNGACLSAQDIIAGLTGAARPGAATIYRALTALCEVGAVKRIPTDNSALYMLASHTAYPQLICSRCGKVEEVHSPEMVRYNTALMKNRDMANDGALLMVAGCKRKECDGDG